MSRSALYDLFAQEVSRIDSAHISKRHERVIQGFTSDAPPKALINGKPVLVFNSNDYLGFRHHEEVRAAEHAASQAFGAGPGAVRFISGTLQIHKDLEQTIARFHDREDAILFSSAFAANMAVLFCLIRGQSKDSVVGGNTLVVSDELNHRSIIDGIRVAGLPPENKAIFSHMQPESLREVLEMHKGKYERVIVVTDGIFSMLGEAQHLADLRIIIDAYDNSYEQGVMLVVDDCHGVGSFGQTGRGVEEVEQVKADVLIGTMGKAFGSDGGYVVGNKVLIEYLRESAATYIYSNNITPGTAGAALQAFKIMELQEGRKMLAHLREMILLFKSKVSALRFTFAADSQHPIQPILIGDPAKTMALTQALFDRGIMVTNINYPVVPKGKDEIRVQISASHTVESIEEFARVAADAGKEVGVI